MKYINHYSLGTRTVTHKGRTFEIADMESFNNFINSINIERVDTNYVPAGYEHRPDLISNVFYNTPTKDWLIMMYNNIADPFEGLNVGDRILIPII